MSFTAATCSQSIRAVRTSPAYYTTLFVLMPMLTGCGSGTIGMRRYDPPTAAAEAIKIYDRNADEKLAGDELKNCPALAASGRRIDRNGDSVVTKQEIQNRMQEIEAGADYFGLDLRVTSNGKPLVGAELTLTPEPFLGNGYQTYTGTTVDGGGSLLTGDGRELPGIPAGFYQAKIVHPGQGIDIVRGIEISDETASRGLEISL